MTRAELFEAAAKMMRMCDEAGVAYAHKYEGDLYCMEPSLSDSAEKYEFPLAIVEGRPVFKGDWLYAPSGTKYEALSSHKLMAQNGCYQLCTFDNLTWNPPRKTFILNGEELPLPNTGTPGGFRISNNANMLGKYWWSSEEDRDLVNEAISKLWENK